MSLFVAGDSTSSSSSLLLLVTVSSAFCWSMSMSKSVHHSNSYYNWHELKEMYTHFLRSNKGLVMVYPFLALLRLLTTDCRFAWIFAWFYRVLGFLLISCLIEDLFLFFAIPFSWWNCAVSHVSVFFLRRAVFVLSRPSFSFFMPDEGAWGEQQTVQANFRIRLSATYCSCSLQTE
jgi:hypothetical protein